MAASLDAIGLVTRDMTASCRFYRTLGLDVPEPAGAEQHFEVTLPNGLRLMWDDVALIKQIEPDWEEPVGQRLSLAFLCTGPAEVDATFGLLREAGFEGAAEPWDAFWGQRYASVLDPDGNRVHLFAPL